MHMSWPTKYALASLPFAVTFSGWRLAEWAYPYFQCKGGLKDLQPCFAGSIDITGFIGIGLFFCQLLWIPAAVLSAVIALSVFEKHNRERIAKGPNPETHVRCPDCKKIIPNEACVCAHCGCKLIPQPSLQESAN
jgi:hypothetical protein